MKLHHVLSLAVLTVMFGLLMTASTVAGTAKPPLFVPFDECPEGAPLSHSYEILEDRSRDGTYDTRVMVNCAGEVLVKAIPGSSSIKQGTLPLDQGPLTVEFTYAACSTDGYSWNINFKNASNIIVATIGRDCNDTWYQTGLTSPDLGMMQMQDPFQDLWSRMTQPQASFLVGQQGSLLLATE